MMAAAREQAKRDATYDAAKAAAQARADELGTNVGLEWLSGTLAGWHYFLLPAAQYRQGRELRCEIVRPSRGPYVP
jgi:hypothetical protein